MKVKSLSRVRHLVTRWIAAHWAPLFKFSQIHTLTWAGQYGSHYLHIHIWVHEIWLVQIDMACKCKIHIRFQLVCMNNKECAVLSCSVMSDSLQPYGLQPARLLCPWGFSRQEYWSGLPFPSPGDLPSPGLNPGLPHCRWILDHLSHKNVHLFNNLNYLNCSN